MLTGKKILKSQGLKTGLNTAIKANSAFIVN